VAYAGFDPTSDSLTIGNFIPAKILMHWQACGHKPIVLMGGGTGLIGDPSGRENERSLMTREMVEANVASQRRIMEKFLDFDPKRPNAAVIVNNADWLGRLGFIDVLRDIGKHFSVNEMIQRDSVKKRLEQRDQGISYTEFSYMLLQAFDYLHLHRTMGCTVQVGGADQYGNIVSGMDLIRREFGSGECGASRAFGVTVPLVTRSDGKKMSKSEGTAIFMSADTRDRTSPYAFYQFWFNLPDADSVQWIRWYTLKTLDEIEQLAVEQAASPHERPAQRALARHMTTLVHGAGETSRIERASAALFSGDVRSLDEATIAMIVAEIPHRFLPRDQVIGWSIVDLLVHAGAAASKREARDFIQQGAVAVSGEVVRDVSTILDAGHCMHGRFVLFRRGKKTWAAIALTD